MFNEADADKMTFQMSLFFKGSQYHRQTGSLYVLCLFLYNQEKKIKLFKDTEKYLQCLF